MVASARRAAPPVPIPPRLLRAGLEFRHRLLDLADRIVPSEAALWDVAAGVQRTKVASALVTSGSPTPSATARATLQSWRVSWVSTPT